MDDDIANNQTESGENESSLPESHISVSGSHEDMDDILAERAGNTSWKKPLLIVAILFLVIIATALIVEAVYPSDGIIVAQNNKNDMITNISTVISFGSVK